MKRLFFTVIIFIFSLNLYAIESGTYRCISAMGLPYKIVLKDSGRAIVDGKRGNWENYGNEALVIREDWILEDRGNGKFIFTPTQYANKCTKLTKQGIVKEKREKEQRIAKKQKAKELALAKKKREEKVAFDKEKKRKTQDASKKLAIAKKFGFTSKDVFIDTDTKLAWQNEATTSVEKQWLTDASFNAGNNMDTSGDTAASYCTSLKLAGKIGWRLPTKSELKGLYVKRNKLLNVVRYGKYWSSSTSERNKNLAWCRDDYESSSTKYVKHYVRCVKDIQ